MRSGTTRIILIGALLSALLLAASPADAKKKHKKPKSPPVTVVSASKSTTSDGELVTVTATCPTGLIAVGGGFSDPINVVGTTLEDLHVVYESRRVGDSAWQVSGARETSAGSPPTLPLTAQVDCRTPRLSKPKPVKKAAAAKKKKVKRITVSEVSAAGGQAGSGGVSNPTASCPAGTQAIGGGYSSTPPPKLNGTPAFPVYFQNLRSSPTAWTSAFTNSGTVARTETSYAYCASGLKLIDATVTVPLDASSVGGLKSATAAARCPKGKALLGGGFSTTQPGSMGPLAFLSEAGTVAGGWQVSAYNLSGVPATLSASGVCA